MKKNELYVIYGSDGDRMVQKLLEKAGIDELIAATVSGCGSEGIPGSVQDGRSGNIHDGMGSGMGMGDAAASRRRDIRIGIKPNLVCSTPASRGATTTPAIVGGIIKYLLSKGFNIDNIVILEGSWVGDNTAKAFKVCGYEELSERFGGIRLVDLQKDGWTEREAGGLRIKVCNEVQKIDYLINVPVLKGHCITRLTCALKNMKGCIPDSEKSRFHSLGLHKPIACLNKIIKQDLVIVDGLNGDPNIETGGNPVRMDRLILGLDPVLVDSYAAKLLGLDAEDIPYIGMAQQMGIGTADLKAASIVEIGKGDKDKMDMCSVGTKKSIDIKASPWKVRQFDKYIVEGEACSACYGSLINALIRLKEEGSLERFMHKFYIGQKFKNAASILTQGADGLNGSDSDIKAGAADKANISTNKVNSINKVDTADIEADIADIGNIADISDIADIADISDTMDAEEYEAMAAIAAYRADLADMMDAVSGRGIGVGNCTKCFKNNIAGCPPTAGDIIDFINKLYKQS